ncbi:hypothetical protein SLS56_011799 [Neofusicoccum ribis]|uniref:Cutinase n=1 Tax=Neofusicoccum ribis TaxID=45134 RepID=A0ABR3SBA5_9PEZI
MKSLCALILCYFVASTIASPFPLKPIEYPVCVEGVHIIIARASAEPPGQGIMGNVAQEVIDQVTGSDSIAVDYPASLQDYAESERQGVEALTQLINASYVDCPTSKIVLMGGNSLEVYSSYARTYGKAAADFVVRRASQEGVL